ARRVLDRGECERGGGESAWDRDDSGLVRVGDVHLPASGEGGTTRHGEGGAVRAVCEHSGAVDRPAGHPATVPVVLAVDPAPAGIVGVAVHTVGARTHPVAP